MHSQQLEGRFPPPRNRRRRLRRRSSAASAPPPTPSCSRRCRLARPAPHAHAHGRARPRRGGPVKELVTGGDATSSAAAGAVASSPPPSRFRCRSRAIAVAAKPASAPDIRGCGSAPDSRATPDSRGCGPESGRVRLPRLVALQRRPHHAPAGAAGRLRRHLWRRRRVAVVAVPARAEHLLCALALPQRLQEGRQLFWVGARAHRFGDNLVEHRRERAEADG